MNRGTESLCFDLFSGDILDFDYENLLILDINQFSLYQVDLVECLASPRGKSPLAI